jgi:hypothetical protein
MIDRPHGLGEDAGHDRFQEQEIRCEMGFIRPVPYFSKAAVPRANDFNRIFQ